MIIRNWETIFHISIFFQVNHFPGTGYITNKLDLAKTHSPFIPKAFEMPKQKESLLKFVGNRWKMFDSRRYYFNFF